MECGPGGLASHARPPPQKVGSSNLRSCIQSGCMDGVIPARACVAACNYGGTPRPRQPCGSVHWQRHTVDLVCNCSTAAAYWNCVVAFFCGATMAASMTRCAVPALTPFAGLRWQHPACLRSQQLKSLCECKTGQPDARLAPMHDACFVIGRAASIRVVAIAVMGWG